MGSSLRTSLANVPPPPPNHTYSQNCDRSLREIQKPRKRESGMTVACSLLEGRKKEEKGREEEREREE